MKARALSGLGRSKEVLTEFLYCLALNPECSAVKKAAQEVWFPLSDFKVVLYVLFTAFVSLRSSSCM